MRTDAVGFFWNDAPVPKPPKPQPPKRTPPERVWERPGFLPQGYEEALTFPVPYFDDHSLVTEMGGELEFDIECYVNFFQVAFRSRKSGKVIDYIMTPQCAMNVQHLQWLIENFTLYSFNGYSYDVPILSFALAGKDNAFLKAMSNEIIVNGTNASDLLRSYKVKRLKLDHVDLIEVAPLRASLKIYTGRIHTHRMQDLPFHPETILTPEQMAVVRYYCVNDLRSTGDLRASLEEQLKLRVSMSAEYGMDLRSKSDAQVAEAVIATEVSTLNRSRAQRPTIDVGTMYRYKVPSYMCFRSPYLQDVLERVRNTILVVDETGSIGMPPELKSLQISIGKALYTMGIGGLHSTEKSQRYTTAGGYRIFDVDVESFYPRMILNQELYPSHLGPNFLAVYNRIVERRIKAKREGNKVVADSLKITINGSYGKLGSQYSVLYAPDLLIQVTLSGQLSLLMLIELLEMYGIQVISANTDGIAIRPHETQVATMRELVKYWEGICSFKTEETEYVSMNSRDVNNYIAVKTDGKTKTKGAYANPWNDPKNPAQRLSKNPTGTICVEAIEAILTKGVPVRSTVYACKDITKFVTVRHVSGGAVKDGVYLGKSVRWYYSTATTGEMLSAKSGHAVPKSVGAKPCMTLPDVFPDDIDFEWYVRETDSMLKDIGYYE